MTQSSLPQNFHDVQYVPSLYIHVMTKYPVELILQEYLARLVHSCKKGPFLLHLAGICMQDACKILAGFLHDQDSYKILQDTREKDLFLQDGFYWVWKTEVNCYALVIQFTM